MKHVCECASQFPPDFSTRDPYFHFGLHSAPVQVSDEDIDAILARGAARTEELTKKVASIVGTGGPSMSKFALSFDAEKEEQVSGQRFSVQRTSLGFFF